MSAITVVVLQRGGRCQTRYRCADADAFRTLRIDGEEWSRADKETLAKMWETVRDEIQLQAEPCRILLCSDAPRADDSAPLPDLPCPDAWSRRLLGEAMRGLPCAAGAWTVNGETLSQGDFREAFPVKRGAAPMYVYTVPAYRLPSKPGSVEASRPGSVEASKAGSVEASKAERDAGREARESSCDALSALAELLATRKKNPEAQNFALPKSVDVMEMIREAMRP